MWGTPLQLTTFAALTGLSGCAEQRVVQAIDVRAISAVQAEIKKQVGIYISAAQKEPTIMIGGKEARVSEIKDGFWCGSGSVGFDISSVKVELTTTLDTAVGVDVGASVPVEFVTIGIKGGYKRNVTNTQALTYNLWPLDIARQSSGIKKRTPTDDDIHAAPIAQVLLDLRTALILSAMKFDYSANPPKSREPQPCFTDYNPEKPIADAGNTFTLGLSITNSVSGGISVKATVLEIGVSGEVKSATGNTLAVSFVQRDLQDLQLLKDAVDEECKYPKTKSPECKQAREKLAEAEQKGVGVLGGAADK